MDPTNTTLCVIGEFSSSMMALWCTFLKKALWRYGYSQKSFSALWRTPEAPHLLLTEVQNWLFVLMILVFPAFFLQYPSWKVHFLSSSFFLDPIQNQGRSQSITAVIGHLFGSRNCLRELVTLTLKEKLHVGSCKLVFYFVWADCVKVSCSGLDWPAV